MQHPNSLGVWLLVSGRLRSVRDIVVVLGFFSTKGAIKIYKIV
jgi:hypothetical protein